MKFSTYLSFNGQCEEAFKFYESCLGAKIEFMATYSGSPMADQVPEDWQNMIMHATLVLGESPLMGADSPPPNFEKPQGFSIMLDPSSIEDAERMFNALAEKGTVKVPLQKTFWSARFGMVVDRFGIPWAVNCEAS